MGKSQNWTRARVTSVEEGPDGKYIVTIVEGFEGSVTCAVDLFEGRREPVPGETILLGKIKLLGENYRAHQGKFE